MRQGDDTFATCHVCSPKPGDLIVASTRGQLLHLKDEEKQVKMSANRADLLPHHGSFCCSTPAWYLKSHIGAGLRSHCFVQCRTVLLSLEELILLYVVWPLPF